MFARRHPILFSLLVVCGIGAVMIISVTALFLFGNRDSTFEFGEKVGVVEIQGVIADAKPIVSQLKKFRKNEAIKAIVLRIDSPGGGVGPSQEIYSEVKKTTSEKKVVASMGAIAASGGYYVAAAADHVMANPGTITGSIGVIIEFANVEELFKKIGLSAYVIKSGEYKDVGSPLRKMTSKERKLLQGFIDNVYEQFVTAVAEGRQMPEKEVRAIADGRIFSGEQAHELGLLDSLGSMEDAIALAAQLGGIEGEPSVVYAEKKKFSLLEFLLGSKVSEAIDRITGGALHSGYLYVPGRGADNG
ncbi:MAG: signal peptide peptidase SppA [Deltaproteobacteria bacterium]|nr:signal peptide peptidase SppA [Deltaproteobacteria bacterium]MBW2170709.1 signal peptide peptidase SppA [Deltaproteobacteria bacterium]MBW2259096.1 signal peptide peptidase SppA [Deltaproteobacteria bacterium]